MISPSPSPSPIPSPRWTYYLGGKLVLPLEYLKRCNYPDDALVVFTDHDVVFQGGYVRVGSGKYSSKEALAHVHCTCIQGSNVRVGSGK